MGGEVLVARLDAGTVQFADGVEHLALTPADGHGSEGGDAVGSGGAGRTARAERAERAHGGRAASLVSSQSFCKLFKYMVRLPDAPRRLGKFALLPWPVPSGQGFAFDRNADVRKPPLGNFRRLTGMHTGMQSGGRLS